MSVSRKLLLSSPALPNVITVTCCLRLEGCTRGVGGALGQGQAQASVRARAG